MVIDEAPHSHMHARSTADTGCNWYARRSRSIQLSGQLQTVTEDIFICTVLVCSAH